MTQKLTRVLVADLANGAWNDFCFEAKQIQFALEFQHMIWKKKVLQRIMKPC